MLTVHRWPDLPQASPSWSGLALADRADVGSGWPASWFWLITDYLPEIARNESGPAGVAVVTADLRRRHERVDVIRMPIPAGCTDGVLGAYWRRPHAYLDAAVRRAMSGPALLPTDVVEPALQRLRGTSVTPTCSASRSSISAIAP